MSRTRLPLSRRNRSSSGWRDQITINVLQLPLPDMVRIRLFTPVNSMWQRDNLLFSVTWNKKEGFLLLPKSPVTPHQYNYFASITTCTFSFFFNLGPAFFSHTFIHQPAWLKFGVKYVSRMPYVRKARDVHLTAASYHTIGIFQWLRGLRIIKSRWINVLLWQREKKHSKKSRGRQPFWLFLTFARWDLPDLVDHPLPTCCEDFFYLLTRSCG